MKYFFYFEKKENISFQFYLKKISKQIVVRILFVVYFLKFLLFFDFFHLRVDRGGFVVDWPVVFHIRIGVYELVFWSEWLEILKHIFNMTFITIQRGKFDRHSFEEAINVKKNKVLIKENRVKTS